MEINELSEETKTTYKVVDLVKDKFNETFTDYHKAIKHCEWCLENGATRLRLITNEVTQVVEEVER